MTSDPVARNKGTYDEQDELFKSTYDRIRFCPTELWWGAVDFAHSHADTATIASHAQARSQSDRSALMQFGKILMMLYIRVRTIECNTSTSIEALYICQTEPLRR